MVELLRMMEYAQASGKVKNAISPSPVGSIQILVNFPSCWRTWLKMIESTYVFCSFLLLCTLIISLSCAWCA